MKFHLPVRLLQSLMACISVAACLGAAAEETVPRDLTAIVHYMNYSSWGDEYDYLSFRDENGNQTNYISGDNVTFSGTHRIALYDNITAGKLTFESGSHTTLKQRLYYGYCYTLSAEHIVLRGTLKNEAYSKDDNQFGISFNAGNTLEMDGGGFAFMKINLGGGTLLYHNSINMHSNAERADTDTSPEHTHLTLSGGNTLQLENLSTIVVADDNPRIDLFTNVGTSADAINVFDADGTRWGTSARSVKDYFTITGRGTGFWANGSLQVVEASDGTYTLQLVKHCANTDAFSNRLLLGRSGENTTYRLRNGTAGFYLVGNRHINFSDNDISVIEDEYTGLHGAMSGCNLHIDNNYQVEFIGNKACHADFSSGNGGAIYMYRKGNATGGELSINNNYSVLFQDNHAARYGGAIFCGTNTDELNIGSFPDFLNNHELKFIGNKVGKSGLARGGAIYVAGNNERDRGLIMKGNNIVHFEGNGADVYSGWVEIFGGAIYAAGPTFEIVGNSSVSFINNTIKGSRNYNETGTFASIIRGGAMYLVAWNPYVSENDNVLFSGNTLEGSGCSAWGGAIYTSSSLFLENNKELIFRGNKVISKDAEALGAAIYAYSALIKGNDYALFEKNLEVEMDRWGNNAQYRLRSIVVKGDDSDLYLAAHEGKKIEFYDTIYVSDESDEAMELNHFYGHVYKGDILFSGLYTEAHLKEMKGSAGTAEEILNSRTSEVCRMTGLYGGRLRIEDGAIYKGYGMHVKGGAGTTLLLKDGTLQHEGYAITINSGNNLTLQKENVITAGTLSMADGSNLNISLKDATTTSTALTITGNITASAINFNLSDVDTLAEGIYQLITRTEGEAIDISNWTLSGVTAGELYWKGGTLYYAGKAGALNISSAEALEQLENIAGNLIINCAGSELTLDKAISASGSMGGDLVINTGSVAISGEGAVAGDIVFNGSDETERKLRVEKDLSGMHMELNNGAAQVAQVEIAEGNAMDLSELRGNGDMQKTGKGAMRINGKGHKLGGKLDVAEGQFVFGGDSTAEVNELVVGSQDDTRTAQVQVNKNAAVTGTKLHVDGQNAVVSNEGSMAFTEEVRVSGGHLDNRGSISKVTLEGGTVSGNGTFAGLEMSGGSLVVGNSPGLQSYSDALALNVGEVVFSVAGDEAAATADTSGWGSNVYSCIDMQGKALTLGENVTLTIALGGAALDTFISSTSETPLQLELTLIQNIDDVSVSFLTDDILASLVEQTQFITTTEADGLSPETETLAGVNIGEFVTDVTYSLSGNNLVLDVGFATNGRPIPEPTTATLSLLALAALAARRRRK